MSIDEFHPSKPSILHLVKNTNENVKKENQAIPETHSLMSPVLKWFNS